MKVKQVQRSAPYRFFWTPSARPVEAAAVGDDPATPFVTFGAPISTAKALTKFGSTLTVTAIGSDRKTLTFDGAVGDMAGLIGAHGGAAWLDLGNAYQGPVSVLTFTSATTAILSEPLPFYPGTGGGTLEWRVWYADLSALEVGDSTARDVPWSIAWSKNLGADVQPEPAFDRGLLSIVRQPFSTGLTHDDLVCAFPMIGHTVPEFQTSWQPQIDAGLDEMIGRIIPRLKSTQYLDQLDGEQFQVTHGLYTAHVITRGLQVATYNIDYDLRAEARKSLERCLSAVRWADANDDGVVDPGETGTDVNPTPSVIYSTNTDPFAGMEPR